MPQELEPGPAMVTTPEALTPPNQPRLILRCRLPGRERWSVDLLEDNPLLAATVELVLRSEEGIEEVCANPLTGRVLIHYRPDLVSESIETLLRRAIAFGPMTPEEFSLLQYEKPDSFPTEHLLAAEVGCSALKMILFGGCCPAALAVAGLLFLFHRHG
jgi:hypothetical protein